MRKKLAMLAQAVLLIYPANIVSAIFILGNSFQKENFDCQENNLCATKMLLRQPWPDRRPYAVLPASSGHEADDLVRLLAEGVLQWLAPYRFQQRAVQFIVAASRT